MDRRTVLLLALVALLPGCANRWLGDGLVPFTTVAGSQTVGEGVTTLVVQGRVGNVRVEGRDPGELTIEAAVSIAAGKKDSTATGAFENHVTVTAKGDTITVVDAHTGAADEDDWGVSLTVYAPPDLAAQLATGTGTASTEGMTSSVTCETGTGNASVESETTDGVDIRTGTGNVSLDVRTIAGGLAVKCGTGSVDASLDKVAGATSAETGSGNLSLSLGSPLTAAADLSSGTGNVELVLPAGSSGSYSLQTGTGAARVTGFDAVVVADDGRSAHGDVGTGAPTVSLQTGTGDVTLTGTGGAAHAAGASQPVAGAEAEGVAPAPGPGQ
jgi:hypothetical protein